MNGFLMYYLKVNGKPENDKIVHERSYRYWWLCFPYDLKVNVLPSGKYGDNINHISISGLPYIFCMIEFSSSKLND